MGVSGRDYLLLGKPDLDGPSPTAEPLEDRGWRGSPRSLPHAENATFIGINDEPLQPIRSFPTHRQLVVNAIIGTPVKMAVAISQ